MPSIHIPEPSIHKPGQNRQEGTVSGGDCPQGNNPKPSGSGSQPPAKLRPTNPLFEGDSSSEDISSEEEVILEHETKGKGRFSKKQTRSALKDSRNMGEGPP